MQCALHPSSLQNFEVRFYFLQFASEENWGLEGLGNCPKPPNQVSGSQPYLAPESPAGLVKTQIDGSTCSLCDFASLGWGQALALLATAQVILMLRVWAPHFWNSWVRMF